MAKVKPWYSSLAGLESLKNQLRMSHTERPRNHDFYLGILRGVAMTNGMDAHVSVHIHDFVNEFGYKEAPISSNQVADILRDQ